jgi:1-aminocyclopropane-1-carboxylate deaminase/D-cysteine desulfhydrase-like pyridoxal-dependent ACC family enzyme
MVIHLLRSGAMHMTISNNDLRKLSFYAQEDAMQFASLMEVGTHACKDEVRYTVIAGSLAYHVVRERFIKKFGYWR